MLQKASVSIQWWRFFMDYKRKLSFTRTKMTFTNILVVDDSDIPSNLTKQTQSQSCALLPY